jgi:hypothetical protein
MGLPNKSLSSTPVLSDYIYPDDLPTTDLLDYELGGIALYDPSEGLAFQRWTLTYVGIDVTIEADNGVPIILFSFSGITQISLAFDQNMNPFVTYVRDGDAWYWWYDSVAENQVHTQMAADVRTPRCCLDDKRESQFNSSDIILAYLRDKTAFYRQQRDRYTIEYTLITGEQFNRLSKVGMTHNLRLKFEYYSA